MPNDQEIMADDAELADALRALSPTTAGITSEWLSYQAGLLAGRRQSQRWRGIAVVAVVFGGGVLMLRKSPASPPAVRPSEPVAVQSTPDNVDPAIFARCSYLRLREIVLAKGWQAIPPPPNSSHLPAVSVMATE